MSDDSARWRESSRKIPGSIDDAGQRRRRGVLAVSTDLPEAILR
jgi:hypothetical protein